MVMRHGCVVEHGPAHTIFDDPSQPYTRALMKAAFAIEADDTGAVAR
jgi:microcin C transport system ATP-binding protein